MKAGAAPAGAAPAAAAAATPIYATLWDLPDPLLEAVFGLLGLNDLAACACASAAFQQAAHRALAAKRAVTAADLPFLARAHNYLLLGGPSCGGSGREGSGGAADHSDHPDGRGSPGPGLSAALSAGTAAADRLRARVLGFAPSALHYVRQDARGRVQDHSSVHYLSVPACLPAGRLTRPARPCPGHPTPHPRSQHCPALQRLHLELPPPQIPLSAAAEAVARAAAGEAWGVGGALALGFGGVLAPPASECPPVDGFLLKLLAQVSSPPPRSSFQSAPYGCMHARRQAGGGFQPPQQQAASVLDAGAGAPTPPTCGCLHPTPTAAVLPRAALAAAGQCHQQPNHEPPGGCEEGAPHCPPHTCSGCGRSCGRACVPPACVLQPRSRYLTLTARPHTPLVQIRPNDAALGVLARSCPELEELVLGGWGAVAAWVAGWPGLGGGPPLGCGACRGPQRRALIDCLID